MCMQEILDGSILGDANLTRRQYRTRFEMNLSKVTHQVTMEDNFRWLEYIKRSCLLPLGIGVSNIYPKHRMGRHEGKSFDMVRLISLESSLLNSYYDRWYAWTGKWKTNKKGYSPCRIDDTKILPKDFVLTPVVLAHWFIGDGGAYRQTRHPNTIETSLACYSFTYDEVYELINMLNSMGIITGKPGQQKNSIKGGGLCIRLAQESVNYFFDLISPHMPSHRGLIQYRTETKQRSRHEAYFNNLRLKLRRQK